MQQAAGNVYSICLCKQPWQTSRALRFAHLNCQAMKQDTLALCRLYERWQAAALMQKPECRRALA